MERKKIKELVNVYNNQRVPLSANQRTNLEKIYPYYGAQGIVDYVDNFIFDGKYILVAEDGENLRSNKQNICNLVDGKFWVNNHAHILAANDENVTEYLYYNFNQIKFEPYITGSAQPKLNKENLLNIETFVHSKSEQQKIAQVLSTLDRKIALNQQINAELEKMAKTLYDYWFVQFDFPDENGNPYKSSGGEMVYNAELKRDVPKGWANTYFSDFINLERGITYGKNDIQENGLGIVRATNITGNLLDLNDLVYIHQLDHINYPLISKFETLIVMSSGSKEHIGKNAIYYFDEPSGFGAFCSKITPNQYIAFVNLFLQSIEFKQYLKSQAIGTNINNLTNGTILNCPIIKPNKEILSLFECKLKKLFEKIALNTKQTQQLTQLRDFLLPMLMNGQVEVDSLDFASN